MILRERLTRRGNRRSSGSRNRKLPSGRAAAAAGRPDAAAVRVESRMASADGPGELSDFDVSSIALPLHLCTVSWHSSARLHGTASVRPASTSIRVVICNTFFGPASRTSKVRALSYRQGRQSMADRKFPRRPAKHSPPSSAAETVAILAPQRHTTVTAARIACATKHGGMLRSSKAARRI